MRRYLLTRLLLMVPAIWLIGSVVFLLSRIIPGTFADRLAEANEEITGNYAGTQTDRRQYLQQLKTTGLDKPLFYFSLRSRAQPDTLDKIFPVQHQQFLRNLSGRYGNWPVIAAYYLNLRQLQQAVPPSPGGKGPAYLQEQVASLFHLVDPAEIKERLQQLKQTAPITLAILHQALTNVEKSFTNLRQQAAPYNNFVPVFKWHGLHNQYHSWLKEIIKGELGNSYRDKKPVLSILQEAMGNTLLLLLSSLLLIFFLGIELSLALAGKQNKWRSLVLAILYILDSIPLFITALLLLTFLAGSGYLVLFPVFGLGVNASSNDNWLAGLLNQLYHLVLPVICLVLASLPYVTTQLYQATQQVLTSEYITTARSKGLSQRQVLRRHAFRNILLPVITLFTGYLPSLISGAVVLEVIFAIPGTGRLLTDAVLSRDYPVVIGLVLFIAALKAFSHLLADFLYFTTDPRTRLKTS